jgi:hypothetical protein
MVSTQLLAPFRETLLTGGYNLLLGSGVSLDSRNGLGEPLRSSEDLRRDLCQLTHASPSTSLTRVYPLLTPEQLDHELVVSFSKCNPGESLQYLPRFLWRRLFTFNIDDALEAIYRKSLKPKQALRPINFLAPFEPTPVRSELTAIHLHGWVADPEAGFVFSASEYARQMSSLNPWMHMLSAILATEPFIIAGTSLNEIDLEYYLSHRSSDTPRRGGGPSLLIEPHPDAATYSDCKRYGLELVPHEFGHFMNWLRTEFPSPPSVTDLVVPDASNLFPNGLEPIQLLRLFTDFELLVSAETSFPDTPPPFLYGREPEWADLDAHVDIERSDYGALLEATAGILSEPDPSQRLLIVLDDPGTGKTTAIKRVALSLARQGKPVLAVRTLSRIDTDNASKCLSRAATPLILLIDSIADHAEQVQELLEEPSLANKVCILGAERSYRLQHLNSVLGSTPRRVIPLTPLDLSEANQLVGRYRQFGLVGETTAITTPRNFARSLLGDPPAVAACRILNDFKPLSNIVESLWAASKDSERLPFVCVALAQYCYRPGLRYSLLQAVVGISNPISPMLSSNVPLRLSTNALEGEFIVCLNAMIGEQVLNRVARREPEILHNAFTGIASQLAPYLNRTAIMRRSPEARLAGRLFDADKVVRPLLGPDAEEFYIRVQEQWAWNSRYWEQRALLVSDHDPSTGLQYARHAVAIEGHPYALTTLGKILIRFMERNRAERDITFAEAFRTLEAAIEAGTRRSRVTMHPYVTLFTGTVKYLDSGGELSVQQIDSLREHIARARARYAREPLVETSLRRLELLLAKRRM